MSNFKCMNCHHNIENYVFVMPQIPPRGESFGYGAKPEEQYYRNWKEWITNPSNYQGIKISFNDYDDNDKWKYNWLKKGFRRYCKNCIDEQATNYLLITLNY